ncbi:DUF7594 domain-containing protein [Cerasicoccus fimbriatus]|uniref:CBM96 family carbohydrate-binding protein n=1 Tax=Cerasicoccus fimbriatus TaxID=3014554 RepID=UPI0022B5A132|nr:DNRLRE domain-containing protein [Cerasicoccus sp. TK19100]
MSPHSINGDLYGIGYSMTGADVYPSDFYSGPFDSDSVLIEDNFILPSTPSYTQVSNSSAALVDYLNLQLNAMREANATEGYVFFRINPDAYIYWNFYQVGMADSGGSYLPTLDYTTESVPLWTSVPLGGGGYVTGVISDPSGDAIYCRTDVGGAFRWAPTDDVDGNGSWVSISDAMVPYDTVDASALMCVESIAVDPSTPGRLYKAVGNPSISPTARGIYTSDDYGATWSLVDNSNTFVIQGNGSKRAHGERLAVDPNDSDIFWYGSSTSGLRKFEKSGGTWTATQISSSEVPYGTTNTGISFVVCDANGGSTILYAGVSDPSVGGVYKSTDGGSSWSKVGGDSLPEPRRAQIADNGTLYVSGGTDGVAKLPRNGTLSLLSTLPTTAGYPSRTVAYHAVAVDPNDATGNTVYVAEVTKGSGIVLRSTDGGATWANQTSISQSREEPDGTKSLTGYWFGSTASLMVNPADSNELWHSDFFGVSRTRDAQNLGGSPAATWHTLQKRQEETVALSLKNAPSGAALLTGLADVGGMRYLDTNARPYGAGGNTTGGSNITGLDFSEGTPDVWVRGTVNSNGSTGSGGVSIDGGENWSTFGVLDSKDVSNASTAGWETFDVGPYLRKRQADGATSVTLVLRAKSGQTNHAYLHFSSKEGTNPPELLLNGSTTLTPTADAYVRAAGGSSNYGNHVELQAQNYYGQANYHRWSYLKFDLSGQAPITSATLRLYRLAEASDTTAFYTTIEATPTTTWVEGDGGTDNSPANEITWSNRPTNLHSTPGALWKGGGRVAVSATNPDNIVWMGIKNGGSNTPMYYSKDRGVTWSAASGGPYTEITGIYTNGSSVAPLGQPLASDRANGYFYAANFGGTSHKIYRSTNQGANWTQVATVSNGNSYNMRTPQLVAAPVSPTCPSGGDVWLCDDGSYNDNGGGLWRSTNAGDNWSPITTVGKVTAVSFGKAETGSGYTVFIHGRISGVPGIYRSDDYGSTWEALPNPTIKDIQALAGDRQNYGKVFIGTKGRGVFQSQ